MSKSKQIFMELREREMLLEQKRNLLPQFYIDQQLKEKYRDNHKVKSKQLKTINHCDQ